MPLHLAGADAEYVLEEDRDTIDPTIFMLKTLTVREMASFARFAGQDGDAEAGIAAAIEVCKLGIRSIRGYILAPDAVAVAKVIDAIIDPAQLVELTQAIRRHNRLGAETEKNSCGRYEPPDPGASAVSVPASPTIHPGAGKKRK